MFDDFPKTRPPLPEERRSQRRSDRITSVATFEHVCNLRVSMPRKQEHVNSAREIEGRLRYLFRDVTGSLLSLSRGVSLYQFYECAGPNLNRCRSYLETIAAPN